MKTYIYPSEIRHPAQGKTFIDFGRDAFGQLEVSMTGNGGEIIELAIGEVTDGSQLSRNPGGYRYFKSMSLTLKLGTHMYKFAIPEHNSPYQSPKCLPPEEAGGEIAPFRYAEINGYEGQLEARQIVYWEPFDDNTATFESSDERLNSIWEFCKYSIKATTTFGKYIDGERERLPYEGDAYINQLGHFCCDCNYTIAERTIEHFLQYPTWPTEWRLVTIFLVRDYYLYSGDKTAVERWFSRLKDRLLLQLANSDGLISGNERIKDIIDWPQSERDGYVLGEINLVPNCYHYAALLTMNELGHDSFYLERAELVRQAIRRTMLKNGYFVDNPDTDHVSLHGCMFALLFGLAEPYEISTLTEFIRSKGMVCSVFGAQFLLETCYKYGLDQYALDLMCGNGLRSWQNMIDKGATITMEAWDDSLKPNQDWNHAWGAAPANIIPRELCGIKPLSPGFDVFEIAPQPASLKYIRLKHPTQYGTIELEVSDNIAQIAIPDGSIGIFKGKKLKTGQHRFPINSK